jgi:hypothetical protein
MALAMGLLRVGACGKIEILGVSAVFMNCSGNVYLAIDVWQIVSTRFTCLPLRQCCNIMPYKALAEMREMRHQYKRDGK